MATVSSATTPATFTTTSAASRGTGTLLFDQGIQLAIFEHLAEAPHRKAQHRNSGTQVEGFLKSTHGAHLVITQADAEAATFAIPGPATATTIASAITATFTLSPILLGISVGISHGPWPAVRRKCDASQGGSRYLIAPP